MALTLTPASLMDSFGASRARYVDVTFDSSYVAGGLVVDPIKLGFARQINLMLPGGAAGLIFEGDYTDPTAPKLKAMYPTGGNVVSPSTLSDPAVSQPTASAGTATLANAPVATAGTATLANAPVASGGSSAVPAGATPVTSTGAQPTLTEVQPTISAPAITVVQPTISAPAITVVQPTLSTPNLGPGRGKEVKAATDLSAVTVRVLCLGT